MEKEKKVTDLPQITGFCRFCGQSRLLTTVGEIPQAQADEMATDECDCPEAKVYQNRERKIKEAKKCASNRFDYSPDLVRLFEELIERVANYDIEKATIKEGEWSHVIQLTSEGYINIKSSKKVEEEVDFS